MEWTTNARDLAHRYNLSLQSVMASADWAIADQTILETGRAYFTHDNVSFVVECRKWQVAPIIDTV